MFFACVDDDLSQHTDALRQPCQLFCGDLVMFRVASLHVGGAEQFEGPLLELGVVGPDLRQLRNERFHQST